MTPRGKSQLDRDVRIIEAALGGLPPSQDHPALVVLSGLPASGKSHLAREIRRRYPIAHLESDALRRALFHRPAYTQPESSRLFAAIHELVRRLLEAGIPTILDATNMKETHREPLYRIVERLRARLMLVRAKAPDHLARSRLKAKLRGADPENRSEADLDVYEMMSRDQEPIRRAHIVVDTSRDITASVDRIVRELQRVND